jgi:hypothetical protein
MKSTRACGFEFKYLSDLGKCVLVAPLKMISLVGKLQQDRDRDTNYEMTGIDANHTYCVRYDDDRVESNVESLTFIDVLERPSGLTRGILVEAVVDNTEYRRIGVIAVGGITTVEGKQVYVI